MAQPKIARLTLSSILLFGSLPTTRAQSPSARLQQGVQALEAKDFTRALEVFSALVKTDPSSTNVGYLAVAESGAGNLSQAIADFKQAIKLGNDSVLTRYGLGSAYLRNHEPEAAARELRLAIAKDPNNLPARYALGVALLDLGRAHQAIPYLEQARKASPSNSQIWISLTRAQFEAGNPQVAVKLTEDAMAAIPDNPKLLVALARLCLQYQQWEKARALLENAVELQPNDAETKLLLANACLHSGNPSETLEVLKGLPPGTGHPGEAMILTAEARALTGDFRLARIDLSLALEADPTNPNYLLVSAWLDQTQAQFEPALATLEKARALEGDKPDLLYQMAVSYYYLGKFAQAAGACETVTHLAPRDDRAYLLDGLSKLELKEMGAARAAIERAVALSPKSALYHRELGVTLFRIGELTSSKVEFDRALTLDPHAVQAYYWRAQVLDQKGEPQRAIEDLETSIALEPKFLEAYSALAKLYSAQGQAQKAATMLDTANKLEQTERPSDRHRDLLLRELSAPLP